MANPGYQNTSPAKVLVSDELRKLETSDGRLLEYDDPFDLANTFLSFEFTPGAGDSDGTSSQFTLRLINPSDKVEKYLFSVYSALNPRAWKSSENAKTSQDLRDNLRFTYYFRWGYIVDRTGIDRFTPEFDEYTALSHIHKGVLLNFSYDFGSNREKIVTLIFKYSNDWSLDNIDGVGYGRDYPIEITIEENTDTTGQGNRKLRAASTILQELLLTYMGGAKYYKLIGRFSEKQIDSINNYANKFIAETCLQKKVDVGASNKFNHVGYDLGQEILPFIPSPVKGLEKLNINAMIDALNAFYSSFGGYLNIPTSSQGLNVARNSPKSTGQPSLNQSKGNRGTPSTPLPAYDDKKFAQAVKKLKSKKEEWFLKLSPTGWKDYNPASNLASPENTPFDMKGYYLCQTRKDGRVEYKLSAEEVEAILNETPGTSFQFISPIVHDLFERNIIADSDRSKYLAWAISPLTSEFNDLSVSFPDFSNKELAGEWTFFDWDTKIHLLNQGKNSTGQNLLDINALKENYDASQDIENNSTLLAPVPDPDPNDVFFVSFKTPVSMLSAARNLLRKLNDVCFKNHEQKLDVKKLEFSQVPFDERQNVEKLLDTTFDWESQNGAIIFGPEAFLEEVFSFSKKIRSFPIEIKENIFSNQDAKKVSRISLASGFSKRADNIITNISYTNSTSNGILASLASSPVVVQQTYSIAKRFEDANFRDKIASVIAFDWNSANNAITSDDSKDKKDSSYEILTQDATLYNFTKGYIANSIGNALKHYRDSELIPEDSSVANVPELEKEVLEELQFIIENPILFESFFPSTDSSPLDGGNPYAFMNLEIGQEKKTKKENIYRYISSSPLANLQRATQIGTYEDILGQDGQNTDELSILLSAKLNAISRLRNNAINVVVEMLGVPEMDIIQNEIARRRVALWVAEPRVPGTYHWLTGMYNITRIKHIIDESGYKTVLSLFPRTPATADDMIKSQYTFIEGLND